MAALKSYLTTCLGCLKVILQVVSYNWSTPRQQKTVKLKNLILFKITINSKYRKIIYSHDTIKKFYNNNKNCLRRL